jgi:hypothetical protein
MKDASSLQLGEITDPAIKENIQGRLVAHHFLSTSGGDHSCPQQAYLSTLAEDAAKQIIRNNPTILAEVITR